MTVTCYELALTYGVMDEREDPLVALWLCAKAPPLEDLSRLRWTLYAVDDATGHAEIVCSHIDARACIAHWAMVTKAEHIPELEPGLVMELPA